MNGFKLLLAAALTAGICAFSAARAADIPGYVGSTQTSPTDQPAEIPLDRANIEVTALLPWVTDTVTASFNLAPDTYETTLKKMSGAFNKDGWQSFTSTLAKNKIIDQITNEGATITIEPSTPILLSEGVDEANRYKWLVTLRATITYSKNQGKDTHSELTTINITVERAPRSDNALGIQISSWNQT